VSLTPPTSLAPVDLEIPGDVSAAAFWLVAAIAHPDAEVVIPKVGINPTRTGLLEALSMMGVSLDIGEQRMVGEEPVADITVRSAHLRGAEISGDLMPGLDEAPALAVAAALAEGRTVLRDAAELRVKESDRIASLVRELGRLGARVEERPDGFVIEGGHPLRGSSVSGGGDHRLTMALAVAGLLAEGETVVEDDRSVSVSYPGFWHDLERLSAGQERD
jgi:3-phosphoshikimate 1-carboxyvinyltransferase